jgi:hypothetical protein
MSVALDGLVDHVDPEPPVGRGPNRRVVVAAAVLATLAVILGPLAGAGLGSLSGPGVDRDSSLTPVARQVLRETDGAYAVQGMVVVPPTVGTVWTNSVPRERVDGQVVQLGVQGLARPAYLPYESTAPAWLSTVRDDDQVFVDVGALAFACTRWPGASGCTGSLLMTHNDEQFIFRAGLGLETPEEVQTFSALETGLPTTLALGTMPEGAVSATVSLEGRGWSDRFLASMSEPGGVGGATLWWVSAPADVRLVTFLDGHNQVIGTAR